jgi:hypothetical protein
LSKKKIAAKMSESKEMVIILTGASRGEFEDIFP